MISQSTFDAGLTMATAFVADREKCALTAYHGSADRPGVWSIGFGMITWQGKPVTPGLTITEEQAYDGLHSILGVIAPKFNAIAPQTVTAGQLAGIYSLAYNCGSGAILSSTLAKLWTAGSTKAAADQFPEWDHAAGVVVLGLQLRRAAERALFLFANS